MTKRILLATCFVLIAACAARAQQPTPANIRCYDTAGAKFINCPVQDGGSGDVTANTGRITLGGEPCSGKKLPFSVRVTTATTTQLVAASMGNKVYICSLGIGPLSATANTVGLVEDDTSACASPTAGLMGSTTAGDAWQIPASGGFRDGGSNASIAITATTNRYVCVITSGTAVTPVYGTYVLAP